MTYLAIILGLLPGFAWLFFYLREDTHPEPKRLITVVFLAGAASSMVALVLQLLIACDGLLPGLQTCVAGLGKGNIRTPWSILLFAFIEEVVKFGAVYFVVRNNKAFDAPVDAMVFTAIGALGFSTVENLGALLNGGTRLALISAVFEVATFRFVGTTLLHTLTSSFVGYCWALSIRNFGDRKFIIYGLMIATGLHAIFNYLILLYDNLLYPVVFVAVIGFFILGDFEKLKRKKV